MNYVKLYITFFYIHRARGEVLKWALKNIVLIMFFMIYIYWLPLELTVFFHDHK